MRRNDHETKAKSSSERERAQTAQKKADEIMADGFVTLAEAARLTGAPQTTLADAVKSGRIPSVKLPHGWMVRVPAVMHYTRGRGCSQRQLEIHRQLIEMGIVKKRLLPVGRPEPFDPQPVDDADIPSATHLVIEGRNRAHVK